MITLSESAEIKGGKYNGYILANIPYKIQQKYISVVLPDFAIEGLELLKSIENKKQGEENG